mmetsp:Transcript_47999/g.102807  ORF Transcript_47999/g.102807 Transcript_47999/m.102807 type:complete len:343 (-) Transcript_47999:79-1107(-)
MSMDRPGSAHQACKFLVGSVQLAYISQLLDGFGDGLQLGGASLRALSVDSGLLLARRVENFQKCLISCLVGCLLIKHLLFLALLLGFSSTQLFLLRDRLSECLDTVRPSTLDHLVLVTVGGLRFFCVVQLGGEGLQQILKNLYNFVGLVAVCLGILLQQSWQLPRGTRGRWDGECQLPHLLDECSCLGVGTDRVPRSFEVSDGFLDRCDTFLQRCLCFHIHLESSVARFKCLHGSRFLCCDFALRSLHLGLELSNLRGETRHSGLKLADQFFRPSDRILLLAGLVLAEGGILCVANSLLLAFFLNLRPQLLQQLKHLLHWCHSLSSLEAQCESRRGQHTCRP